MRANSRPSRSLTTLVFSCLLLHRSFISLCWVLLKMDPQDFTHLTDTAHKLMAAKMYSLASCVMLFYDIAITSADEVEIIWMQPKWTHMTLLWALNRYLSPLGFIVVILSFHMHWATEVCDRYVLFPEGLKVVTALVIGIIFVLRLYAIYGKSKLVASFGGALLLAQLGVKIWSFTDGTYLVLPDGLDGCILVGRTQSRFVFTWVAELIFDTVVFLLTLWRTVQHYRLQRGRPMSLISLILRDGIIYFAVIFVANVVTVALYLWAPLNLKAVNASFSTLITSLMVSRLILNLKIAGRCHHTYEMPGANTSMIQTYEDDSADNALGVRKNSTSNP